MYREMHGLIWYFIDNNCNYSCNFISSMLVKMDMNNLNKHTMNIKDYSREELIAGINAMEEQES